MRNFGPPWQQAATQQKPIESKRRNSHSNGLSRYARRQWPRSNVILCEFKIRKENTFCSHSIHRLHNAHCTLMSVCASGIDYFDFADWNENRKTIASPTISTITFYLCLLSSECVCFVLFYSPVARRENACAGMPNGFVCRDASRMNYGMRIMQSPCTTMFGGIRHLLGLCDLSHIEWFHTFLSNQ